MAGLDGIKNKIEPPAPVDKDLYELPPEEHASVPTVPADLSAVLDALEADNEWLQQGDVFTADLIETWVELKRADIDAVRLRPHPHEFELYYDA
jgi:glutamine synthetase